MNIFFLSNNPKECAELHCDKHVVKMILEYAQLLSTTHRFLDGTPVRTKTDSGRNVVRYQLSDNELNNILYTATHINHPSAVWVRQSDKHYQWLANLLIYLCEEYTHRYEKIHKVERTGLSYVLLKTLPKNIPVSKFVDPPPAMPDECKISGNVISSYHKYYIEKKVRFARWTKRQAPVWFTEGVKLINANV